MAVKLVVIAVSLACEADLKAIRSSSCGSSLIQRGFGQRLIFGVMRLAGKDQDVRVGSVFG